MAVLGILEVQTLQTALLPINIDKKHTPCFDLAIMAGFLATQESQDHKSVLSNKWTASYP